MKVFAYHNPDDEIRLESSSGGLFTALASEILAEDGVVYGAAFGEDWKVEHIRVDNEADLKRLRGSKYVYSDFASSIAEALKDLEAGRKVLFTGTPCQVAAMRKRAGDRDNLLLIEVVCHGAPEPSYWERYLEEICKKLHRSKKDIESVNFRDKRAGWKDYSFTIRFKDGKTFTQRHEDNLYMRAFLKDYTPREACFRCPFKYPDGSKADLTLGDFWGISQLAPDIDNNLGTCVVILRNEAKEEAVKNLQIDKALQFEDITKYNPAIIRAASKPAQWENFQREVKGDDLLLSAKKDELIRLFKKYAGRPLRKSIYLYLARLKHKILK